MYNLMAIFNMGQAQIFKSWSHYYDAINNGWFSVWTGVILFTRGHTNYFLLILQDFMYTT